MAKKSNVELVIRAKDEASAALKVLTDKLDQLEARQKKLNKQKDLTTQYKALGLAVDKSRDKVIKLQAQLNKTKSKKGAEKVIEKETRAVNRAVTARDKQITKLDKLSSSLKVAGVDTAKLTSEEIKASKVEKQLARDIDATNKRILQRKKLETLRARKGTTGPSAGIAALSAAEDTVGRARANAATKARILNERKLRAELGRTGSRLTQLAAAEKKVAASTRTTTKAVKDQTAALQKNNRISRTVGKNMTTGGRSALSLYQRLRSEVIALATAYVGLQGSIRVVNELYETQRQFSGAKARLGIAFDGDDQEAGKELDFVRAEADRLGLSFETLTAEYTKFLFAAKKSNLTNEQSRQIFTSVAEAAVVNRLSTDQMALAYRALTQVVSKGKVQAEELRNQLGDHIPGAVQTMAESLGLNTKELDKMMEQGLLTEEALVDFANTMRKQLADVLPEAAKTTTAELGRVQSAWTDLKLIVNEELGFDKALGEFLKEVKLALAAEDIKNLAEQFVALGRAVGKFVVFGLQNLPTIVGWIKALVAYKVIAGFAKLVGGLRTLRLAFFLLISPIKTVTVALAAGGGMLGALTALAGPVGWLVGGVAALAGAFLLLRDNSEVAGRAVRDSLSDVEARVQQLRDSANFGTGDLGNVLKQLELANDRLGVLRQNERDANLNFSKEVQAKIDKEKKLIEALTQERDLINKRDKRDKPDVTVPSSFELPPLPGSGGKGKKSVDKAAKELDRLLKVFRGNRKKIREYEADTLAESLDLVEYNYQELLGSIVTMEEALQGKLAALVASRNAPGLAPEKVAELDKNIRSIQASIDSLSAGKADIRTIIDFEKLDAVKSYVSNALSKVSEEVAKTTSLTFDRQVATIKDKFAALQSEIAGVASVDQIASVSTAQKDALQTVFEEELNRQLEVRNRRLEDINNQRAIGVLSENQVRDATYAANEQLRDQLLILSQLAESNGLDEVAESAKRAAAGVATMTNEIAIAGEELNHGFVRGMADAFEQFVAGTLTAKEAFRAFAADFLKQIADMILQKAILNSIGGGGLGGIIAGAILHTGGTVGVSGTTRQVPSWVFGGAPRYHAGGIAGLAPNEVPAILQKGETIIPKGGFGQPQPQSIRNILIDERANPSDYFDSSEGEKVLVQAIRRNSVSVRSVLGV